MENKLYIASSQRLNADRVLYTPFVSIDLQSFIKQIREEEQWEKSDRNVITIFKSLMMRIVLIILKKGAEMKKHKTTGSISVQVIEGEMLFNTDDQTITLSRGQMLVFHEGIPHSVLAKEETIFLLTLTTTEEN
jgi:quercetin dioxygenase-like cupin family protein